MDCNTIKGMGMARQIRGMEQIKQPVIIFITGYENMSMMLLTWKHWGIW